MSFNNSEDRCSSVDLVLNTCYIGTGLPYLSVQSLSLHCNPALFASTFGHPLMCPHLHRNRPAICECALSSSTCEHTCHSELCSLCCLYTSTGLPFVILFLPIHYHNVRFPLFRYISLHLNRLSIFKLTFCLHTVPSFECLFSAAIPGQSFYSSVLSLPLHFDGLAIFNVLSILLHSLPRKNYKNRYF